LTAHRQATAMTNAPVAAQVHQSLDVHGYFSAQIAFNDDLAHLSTQCRYFGIGKIFDKRGRLNARVLADRQSTRSANAENMGESHPYVLTHRNIDTGYAGHR
jgi:hypothetical protein